VRFLAASQVERNGIDGKVYKATLEYYTENGQCKEAFRLKMFF
jgi:hypothetical protein